MHIISGLYVGGAEIALFNLLNKTDKERISSLVVSMGEIGPVGEKLSLSGIPVKSLGMRRGVRAFLGMISLVQLIKKENPDVIQTWMHHADFFGTLAAIIAGNFPVVWNVRCAELKRKDHGAALFWILWLLAKLSRIPKAIIVNSAEGKKAHQKLGYKAKRWEIIPNGIPTNKFVPSAWARENVRKSLGLDPTTPLIGLVARFHPMKDHNNFLEAAAELVKKRPEVHFLMVGKGIDHENLYLVRLIDQYGLGGRVHLLGERDDIATMTAALDIATCSSYSEGFPNVLGEAMSSEVLCVSTKVGDAEELIKGVGEIVPPQDSVAMAQAWSKLLALEQGERQSLGKKARDRVKNKFSLFHTVSRYEKVYREVGQPRA